MSVLQRERLSNSLLHPQLRYLKKLSLLTVRLYYVFYESTVYCKTDL